MLHEGIPDAFLICPLFESQRQVLCAKSYLLVPSLIVNAIRKTPTRAVIEVRPRSFVSLVGLGKAMVSVAFCRT